LAEETLRSTILNLAGPAVEAEGLAIWGLELNTSGRMLVRLYVEPENTEASEEEGESTFAKLSASVDQCESISRQLAFALDAEDCIERAYTLEVSSPGFNRIFFTVEQMKPYLNDMVEARMQSPYSPHGEGNGRRTWRGLLKSVGQDAFIIQVASVTEEGEIVPDETLEPIVIPFALTRRVNRVHVFRMPQKPGKGAKPGKSRNTNAE